MIPNYPHQTSSAMLTVSPRPDPLPHNSLHRNLPATVLRPNLLRNPRPLPKLHQDRIRRHPLDLPARNPPQRYSHRDSRALDALLRRRSRRPDQIRSTDITSFSTRMRFPVATIHGADTGGKPGAEGVLQVASSRACTFPGREPARPRNRRTPRTCSRERDYFWRQRVSQRQIPTATLSNNPRNPAPHHSPHPPRIRLPGQPQRHKTRPNPVLNIPPRPAQAAGRRDGRQQRRRRIRTHGCQE